VAAPTQSPTDSRYSFAIGDESHAAPAGHLWVYCYSWYGLEKLELSSFERGGAALLPDATDMRQRLNPHPNTDACLLILEFPENLWYRTPDVRPDAFWQDPAHVLEGLGRRVPRPSGETLLVLPAPLVRRVTLLHPNGRPVVGVTVPLSIYLYDKNHCAAHFGLPLGTFETDGTGSFEVTAIAIPLHLDLNYYEKDGMGPAGQQFMIYVGLKTGPEEKLVIQRAWNIPNDDDFPERNFELRVRATDGSPRTGISVVESIRLNKCGDTSRFPVSTGSDGVARLMLSPPIVLRIALRASDAERVLSDDELRELFSREKLTVIW